MVINKFFVAFLVLLGSSSSWAGIRERFDYNVKRSAEGTEIYLYSIPDQYKETRIYDKNGFLRSLNSRVGDLSLEVTPNSMLFEKSDEKFYQRYYFERSAKAFVLTRMTQGQPEVYHKKGDSFADCAARVDPRVSLKQTAIKLLKASKSCEPYTDLIGRVNKRLTDKSVTSCLDMQKSTLTANVIRDKLDLDHLSEIECNDKLSTSEYNTGSKKITLGMDFLSKPESQAQEVLLHELLHKNQPVYNNPKEQRCGPTSIQDIEDEIELIVKGCLSQPEKLDELKSQIDENRSLIKSINRKTKDRLKTIETDFVDKALVTQKELNFFLKKIQDDGSLNKFNLDIIVVKQECKRVTKEIFGGTCPRVENSDQDLVCIFDPPYFSGVARFDYLENPSPQITAASTSSEAPIPVLNQRLPADNEAIHEQVQYMLPGLDKLNSVANPRQLMNDLQSAVKRLVLPNSIADTKELPANVKKRLSTLQLASPTETNGRAVSAFKMELVAKSLVNTAFAEEPAEPASKPSSADKNSIKPVVKQVAGSKSSGATDVASQSLTENSGSGSSGAASSSSGSTGSMGSGLAPAKGSAPTPIAKTATVSLDHNPVEYLNREFASRAQSEQVIKDLKSREAELRAKNIQVIIGKVQIGSPTPRRKLKWDGSRFVEEKN